jgi:hypothetical protein
MNMMCKLRSFPVCRNWDIHIDNMKSRAAYDYHGPWDTNVVDQAPVSNPHTSILDIHDSALLYIRAGVDLAKGNQKTRTRECLLRIAFQ